MLLSSHDTGGALAAAKAAAASAAAAAAFSALEWCELFSRKDTEPFDAFVFPRCPTGGKLASAGVTAAFAWARPGVASKVRSSAAPCA